MDTKVPQLHNYMCVEYTFMDQKSKREERRDDTQTQTQRSSTSIYYIFLKLYVVPGYPVYRYPVLVDTVYSTLYTVY